MFAALAVAPWWIRPSDGDDLRILRAPHPAVDLLDRVVEGDRRDALGHRLASHGQGHGRGVAVAVGSSVGFRMSPPLSSSSGTVNVKASPRPSAWVDSTAPSGVAVAVGDGVGRGGAGVTTPASAESTTGAKPLTL